MASAKSGTAKYLLMALPLAVALVYKRGQEHTLRKVDVSSSGSSGVTARGLHPDAGTRVYSLGRSMLLAGVVIGWALFAVTAFTNPEALDELWVWVGDLPIAGQIVAWTVGLPWMLGIVILQQSAWTDLARIASIATVAILSFIAFLPSRS